MMSTTQWDKEMWDEAQQSPKLPRDRVLEELDAAGFHPLAAEVMATKILDYTRKIELIFACAVEWHVTPQGFLSILTYRTAGAVTTKSIDLKEVTL